MSSVSGRTIDFPARVCYAENNSKKAAPGLGAAFFGYNRNGECRMPEILLVEDDAALAGGVARAVA
ncbi:MAG: hypothetical protein J6L72_12295, partial [Butyricicoccus sp.]|nr:hypothetical protein [Butyricicoccus sp.]